MTNATSFFHQLDDATNPRQAILTDAGKQALRGDPEQWLDVLEQTSAGPLQVPDMGLPGSSFAGANWPHLFAAVTARRPNHESNPHAHVLGRLNADLGWLPGHFPGQPVLPGVVQIHWAGLLGTQLLQFNGDFCALNVVKFQQIMQPGRAFLLQLDYAPDKQVLRFQYQGTQGLFSQGRINFSAKHHVSD